MLLPLITYPYLIRVLGAEIYGVIVFAQVVIGYFSNFINFGFGVSATKMISENRDDKTKISQITSNVIIAKLLLWLLSFLVLGILILFIPHLHENWKLYLLSFGVCFNEFLFPQWYFQGVERMKYITYINMFTRSLFVAFVFLLVKEKDDFLLVPLLNGLGALLAGSIALLIVFNKENVRFQPSSFRDILVCVKESFIYFLPSFFILINERINVIIIGLFLNMKDVAYYDLSMKIVTVVKTPLMLINQAVFPHFSWNKDLSGLKKILKFSLTVSIMSYILLTLFSKFIIMFLGGEEMLPSLPILKLLAVIIPIATVASIYGLALVVKDLKQYYANADIFAVILNLALLILLYYLNSITLITVTLVAIASTTYALIYKMYYRYKYKIM